MLILFAVQSNYAPKKQGLLNFAPYCTFFGLLPFFIVPFGMLKETQRRNCRIFYLELKCFKYMKCFNEKKISFFLFCIFKCSFYLLHFQWWLFLWLALLCWLKTSIWLYLMENWVLVTIDKTGHSPIIIGMTHK